MIYGQSYLSPNSLNPLAFDHPHPVLECLTALSYRSGDLGLYLTEIVLGVSRLIQSDWTIITICAAETGKVVASNLDLGQDNAGFATHGTLADAVVRSGRSLIIADSRQAECHNQLPQEYLGYLGVPLRTTSGTVIGTICSFLREPRAFTDAEVKIVELFADRAATAIENYQLYQQQLQFNARLSQEVAACSIDLKRSQEQLIEQERLAAIGEFTAMIVHEVRNPLTTVTMGLQYAQKVLAAADQQRLGLALSEAQRLNQLLNEILCYAKPQALKLARLNVGEFLNDLLIQMQDLPEAADRPISYARGFPDIAVMADVDKLRQVFLNLFRNAFEAIAPHETVSCCLRDGGHADRICISIHNGGTPIPRDLLPQITTPFCTTKPSGTGLGLAIAKRIITAHQGELMITSAPTGTTVSIYLPICA